MNVEDTQQIEPSSTLDIMNYPYPLREEDHNHQSLSAQFERFSFQPSTQRQHTDPFTPRAHQSTPQPTTPTEDLHRLAHQFGLTSLVDSPHSIDVDESISPLPTYHRRRTPRRPSTPSSTATGVPSRTPSNVRSQRQAGARLQTQPAHRREIEAIVERTERRIAEHMLAAAAGGKSASLLLADEEYEHAGAVQPVPDEQLLCPRQPLSYRGRLDLGRERQWVEKPIRVRRATKMRRHV
jgi:hypothetical protein